MGSETRLTRASAESLLDTCADAIPLLRELDDARASSLIRQLEDLQDELRAQLLAGQITPGGPSGVVGVDWAAAPLREGD